MLPERERIDLPDLAVSLNLSSSLFTVQKVLQGGMGVCAKIVHDQSAKPFALKLVNDAALKHSEALERFRQEVKIWASASTCDAVVRFLSVFRLNEVPCVCSEWMEGGDLRGYVGNRDTAFFYRTVDRVLAALEWVHTTYGVIHRDLKPGNILLDDQRNAYIADWGISRVVSVPMPDKRESRAQSHAPTTLTQTGQFVGTVIYSAPEQILGSRAIDHRADIYSIGCVLYEWETGEPPFTGENPEQIAYQHLDRPAPRIGGMFRRSGFGAERVIARCLQKRPTDRYQTYAEFRSELRSCANTRDIDLKPFTPRAREAMPLVGAEEIRRKGFKDAVVGSKGYALVEQKSLVPYLKEAHVLCTVGEWTKAYDILIRLYIPEMAAEFPDHEFHQGVVVNLGHCLWGLGRISEAIDLLTTISGAKKKPAEYFVNLSHVLLIAQRYAEAEVVAREGLVLNPNDADILGNLGIALGSQGRHADALAVAQRRVASRRDVHSLEELAVAHMDVGRDAEDLDWEHATREYAKAIKLLNEAVRLNPQYLTARLNLATAWFRLDDFPRASEELTKVQFDKWTMESAVTLRAECLNRVAAFEECVTFCNKWLKEFPESTHLQRVRAETLADGYSIGKQQNGVRIVVDTSLEFFTNIVRDEKKCRPSDFRYLARLKHWMGETENAFKSIDDAEKLEPKHWENSFNRAAFYWQLGDLTSALYHGQKACTLAKWRPQVWRLIAVIQDSLGQGVEAAGSRDREKKVAQARIKMAQDAVARS